MTDVIDWCNTLVKKKIKKFLEGVLHLLLLCVIFFVEYQHVRCGVIPLKVLHLLGGFGVIVV